jgi:hypothetical protein
VYEKAFVSAVRGDVADLIALKSGEELFGVDARRLETVIPKRTLYLLYVHS